MKKYKVCFGIGNVAPVIAKITTDRETLTSVWVGGRRSPKRSSYDNYYDTWEEAHSALIAVQGRQIDSLDSKLRYAKKVFDEVLAMDNHKEGAE